MEMYKRPMGGRKILSQSAASLTENLQNRARARAVAGPEHRVTTALRAQVVTRQRRSKRSICQAFAWHIDRDRTLAATVAVGGQTPLLPVAGLSHEH